MLNAVLRTEWIQLLIANSCLQENKTLLPSPRVEKKYLPAAKLTEKCERGQFFPIHPADPMSTKPPHLSPVQYGPCEQEHSGHRRELFFSDGHEEGGTWSTSRYCSPSRGPLRRSGMFASLSRSQLKQASVLTGSFADRYLGAGPWGLLQESHYRHPAPCQETPQ